SWPAARPRLALYEVHGQPDFGLTYRRALAAVLKRHEGKLSGSAGVALVTSSRIARGLLTATFWLAPPRYPAFMTDSLDDGMLWLSGQAQCGDARAWTREYEHLKREHLERTRPRRLGGTR